MQTLTGGMNFSAMPPIDVPFRFFITAPIFMIFAAVTMLFFGEAMWQSRWQPELLAITHFTTLGFLASVMLGATMQILPVISGIGFKQPRQIARIIHIGLLVGVINLALTFVSYRIITAYIAAICLFVVLAAFIAPLFSVLKQKLTQGHTINGVRLAYLFFVIGILLGFILLAHKFGIIAVVSLPINLTDSHALIGLLGWMNLLIIAISFQLIPMFHVTPALPKSFTAVFPWLYSVTTVLVASSTGWLFDLSATILSLLIVSFCGQILLLLSKRKRKLPDITINYWRLAMSSQILLVAFWGVLNVYDTQIEHGSLLLVSIFVFCNLISVVQGMLLKIIPFLTFTHLQQLCLSNFNALPLMPTMQMLVPKHRAQLLFILHCCSSIFLPLTIIFPQTYQLFAISLLLEFILMLFITSTALVLYRQKKRQIIASA